MLWFMQLRRHVRQFSFQHACDLINKLATRVRLLFVENILYNGFFLWSAYHVEAVTYNSSLTVTEINNKSCQKEINDLVQEILGELGLMGCADTLLGGGLIKGVSGGERKRTSVGVELVVRPSIIVFDEPTSGLDSFNAEQLIKVLRRVATAGSSVLFTIHQPPSPVFHLFDHLILLNHGRVMYSGKAK